MVRRVLEGLIVAALAGGPQLGVPAPGAALRDNTLPCTNARVAHIEYAAFEGNSHRPIPYFGKVAIYTTDLGEEATSIDGKPWAARVIDQGRRGHTFPGREHIGDAVQVCLKFRPPITSKAYPGCAPTDPRGRVYRIYDYRLHEIFEAWNSTHGCGGA